MNSVRINNVVEGETEESFVNDLLAPHLQGFSIFATPRLLGGVSTYKAVEYFVCKILKQDQSAYCTTMIDLYALPYLFENHAKDKTLLHLLEKGRFIPYIQAHEFEAILFSDPMILAEALRDIHDGLHELQSIVKSFPTPEDINDSRETAPSKRIRAIYGRAYDKVVYGSLIAEDIGLVKIREKCPHFNQWLTELESLAD